MSVEIDHLGIAVRSLGESLVFYEEVLGMGSAQRELVAAERVEVAMFTLGSGSAASRVELLEGTDAASPVTKFIDKRGPGLHHVAYRVEDLEAAVGRLRSSGARLMNEPRRGAGGHMYVFVHPASTGGVLIELIQK